MYLTPLAQEVEALDTEDESELSEADTYILSEIVEEAVEYTCFGHSDDEMARVYGASQGTRRFSGVVGTIELEDFIIEFGAWCHGQSERCLGFNPYNTWQALFQHLEGAPIHDYSEFEIKHAAEIDIFRAYWAPDFKNLFGGEMFIGSRRVGTGILTLADTDATSTKEEGEGSSKEESC